MPARDLCPPGCGRHPASGLSVLPSRARISLAEIPGPSLPTPSRARMPRKTPAPSFRVPSRLGQVPGFKRRRAGSAVAPLGCNRATPQRLGAGAYRQPGGGGWQVMHRPGGASSTARHGFGRPAPSTSSSPVNSRSPSPTRNLVTEASSSTRPSSAPPAADESRYCARAKRVEARGRNAQPNHGGREAERNQRKREYDVSGIAPRRRRIARKHAARDGLALLHAPTQPGCRRRRREPSTSRCPRAGGGRTHRASRPRSLRRSRRSACGSRHCRAASRVRRAAGG